MTQSIHDRLKAIVCDRLDVSPELFTEDASFVEQLGADSLDLVDLIMNVEEEFKIQIPDDDYVHFATVKHAIDYLTLHEGNAAASPENAGSEAAE
jgi:acyl carrier protein